jgi:peroxiredoxin
MKTKLTLFSTLLLSAAFAFAQVETGKPAPDFTATDINGKTHKLSDYKGKVVVLESINLDCPFVENHYKTGAMPELQKEATGKGVVWLLVSSVNNKNQSYRAPTAAKKEMSEYNMAATAWLDDSSGTIGKMYGMKTTPHMFVIDKQGKVVYQGAIDDKPDTEGDPRKARNYVKEAVEKTLAGQKVQVAQTKPYGCGIKYAK